jgi:Uma2 family endonuclease
LTEQIIRSIESDGFEVRQNSARGAVPDAQRFVPDVCVVPVGLMAPMRASTGLEVYADSLPFVAEVWSPSTGDYDVDSKFPGYRERGDAVIWRIHPHDRTVTAWVRQPDGSYTESVHRAGKVPISSLPGVVIDLDRLFR